MNKTSIQRYMASKDDCGLVGYHSTNVFPKETHVFRSKPHLDFDGIYSPRSEETSQHLHIPATGVLIEREYSNEILNYIREILMEDGDFVNKPSVMLHHDSLALQATEESLYAVLTNKQTTSNSTDQSLTNVATFMDHNNLEIPSFGYSMKTFDNREMVERSDHFQNTKRSSRRNLDTEGDENDIEVVRSRKQLANNVGETEPLELYDHILLSEFNHLEPTCGQAEGKKQSNRGRTRRVKEIVVTETMVDLRSLLLQCAQAVVSYDSRTVIELMRRIQRHSSPYGDENERVAHYFHKALEARIAGTGPESYTRILVKNRPADEILRAYGTYVNVCPFRKVSNLLANRTIYKLAVGANTLHIIDFGILFGYQWPHLIQRLSERPGGPPKLRITGIDFPLPGLRPAQRLADTGITLKNCCARFGVQFEYNSIAQKWETINIEDLNIDKNDLLIVSSMYSLHNVPDETVTGSNPRNGVIKLIKRINPRIFIHGIINGNHSVPFFITRFREALFHYSSLFDMFGTTVSKGDQYRVIFEEEVFGRDVMNIISCEGLYRVERPETYKQWQARCKSAGFKQLPLDQEIMNFVRCRIKKMYNKDFTVDEDGKWILQGWKGRVNNALSFWQPAKS